MAEKQKKMTDASPKMGNVGTKKTKAHGPSTIVGQAHNVSIPTPSVISTADKSMPLVTGAPARVTGGSFHEHGCENFVSTLPMLLKTNRQPK